MRECYGLIADVGGTNIRLALSDGKSVDFIDLRKYLCADFDGIRETIEHYLQEVGAKVQHACIAIASPVDSDWIDVTNNAWTFSKASLKKALGLRSLHVINDYTAMAMALPHLGVDQLVQIGPGEAEGLGPKAVFGPGTGLGVAHLINAQGVWQALPGEGGHVDFAPIDEQEVAIWRFLSKRYSHVSYEQLLSGLGLEQLYQALCHLEGGEHPTLKAPEISSKGVSGECELCVKVMSQFCKVLGSFAGNLALTLETTGGVYVTGGIVPRFTDFVANSSFRTRFEEKGRFKGYVSKMPTFLVVEEQPGLLGAAASLMQV